MRKKLFTLTLIVILLGMMGTVSPAEAISTDTVWLPLRDDVFGDPKDGGIVIDLAHAHYTAQANVGSQNGKSYYELKAYNPSGIPTTITWGMVQATMHGSLRFMGKFDSITLAWIESYGLTGAIYSIRPI